MESSKLATLTWLISNSLKGLPLDCPFARQFLAWASRPEAGWSGQSGGIQYPWMCNIDTSCTFFRLGYLLQNQYTTSKNIPISSQLSKKKHQKNSKVPLLFCLFFPTQEKSATKKNQPIKNMWTFCRCGSWTSQQAEVHVFGRTLRRWKLLPSSRNPDLQLRFVGRWQGSCSHWGIWHE